MLYNPLNDYDKVGQTMIKAASYIEEHGHTKFTTMDDKGRVCLLGALLEVDKGGTVVIKCCNELAEKLGMCEITWNNMPERTGDEVIGLLRECAESHKIAG